MFIWVTRLHQLEGGYMTRIEVGSLQRRHVLQAIRDHFGIHHDQVVIVTEPLHGNAFGKAQNVVFMRTPAPIVRHQKYGRV